MSILSLYSKIQLKIGKVEKEIARRSGNELSDTVIARERSGRSNPVTTRKEFNHGIAASAFLSLRSFSLLAMTMWRRNKNFCSLLFWKTLKTIIWFFALLFNNSSENFLMFASEMKCKTSRNAKETKLPVGSLASKIVSGNITFVCNNSFCQYKRFQKRVRFFSLTAFMGILVATIITSSVLYLMMPNKPSSYAATFTWEQTDWSGGADTVNFPVHPTNQTSWTKFYSKGNVDISTAGEMKLERITD